MDNSAKVQMNPTYSKKWNKILEVIQSQLPAHNFRAWFGSTRLKEVTEQKVVVATPSAFISQQLGLRYLRLLEQTIVQVIGQPLRVEFIVEQFKKEQKEESREDVFKVDLRPQFAVLNPKYTLDNFVVGLSNNVAYAAAQAVVENPGISYNPLFIYGGTGVGKTHLMVGIGNAVLAKNPHCKILYCSSEKFTNDYVEAIQTRKMGELRNRYRLVDLLLIDDIQFFSGREGTQEEFFHTFNELQARNSQIILTSDRAPAEMEKLADRLKSRLQGGLMVDIQLPDFDTRVAILKAKCLERGELVSEEALKIIAQNFESNARELEGKLIQVIQALKIQGKELSVETIQHFLGARQAINLQNIHYSRVLSTVCEYFNVRLSDLTGPKRQKELVLPRHIAMHILSEELAMTVEKIGEILGNRDHTTVMHGRDKMKKLMLVDQETQRMFSDIKNSLVSKGH